MQNESQDGNAGVLFRALRLDILLENLKDKPK